MRQQAGALGRLLVPVQCIYGSPDLCAHRQLAASAMRRCRQTALRPAGLVGINVDPWYSETASFVWHYCHHWQALFSTPVERRLAGGADRSTGPCTKSHTRGQLRWHAQLANHRHQFTLRRWHKAPRFSHQAYSRRGNFWNSCLRATLFPQAVPGRPKGRLERRRLSFGHFPVKFR